MTKQELMQKLASINDLINEIVTQTNYVESPKLIISDADDGNADDIFILNEVYRITDALVDIQGNIEYLQKPIKNSGKIYRNTFGKYEIEDTEEWYTQGAIIEYLVEQQHLKFWKKSRVAHNECDYYIVGDENVSLNGLTVRMRGTI